VNVHRRAITALSAALVGGGVCLLAYIGYVRVDARVYQQASEARLIVASHAVEVAHAVRHEGDLLGEITNDRIGLRAVISEGESEGVLRRAAGHVPSTAAPGETGNVALAGHRDGLFRPLREIRVGDVLAVTTHGTAIHYTVEWTRVVTPTDVWVLGPVSGHVLTLITCYPFAFIGSAPDRFIVRAREVVPH
jgi:sortase A